MTPIDITTPIRELQQYLSTKNCLYPGETILKVEKPGEGNMNVVLRIITDQRSFIAKQSRPYVQKYQDIEAPLDRIEVEHQFYQAIQNEAIRSYIPAILSHDPEEHLVLMEDLGQCHDMTFLYGQKHIPLEQLQQLVHIVHTVHTSETPVDFPKNRTLRNLNHQHIFVLPFEEDNGFHLDDVQIGLQALSLTYKNDRKLQQVIDTIGKRYLSDGTILLHGDYYPGSWMMEQQQIYMIDPEFSFMGFAEFDLGVMAAHLIIATMEDRCLDHIATYYTSPFDRTLTRQMAGIEIMRRLIGLAQLPLNRSIPEKAYLLQMAHKMILS